MAEYANRRFYDPDYTSCTSFLAHIAETRFGFNAEPVAELVKWADIVDGALYESPEAAVEMAEPAMKLTLIIESTQDPGIRSAPDSFAHRDAAGGGVEAAVRGGIIAASA